jgi:hypothetical protein
LRFRPTKKIDIGSEDASKGLHPKNPAIWFQTRKSPLKFFLYLTVFFIETGNSLSGAHYPLPGYCRNCKKFALIRLEYPEYSLFSFSPCSPMNFKHALAPLSKLRMMLKSLIFGADDF